jgi:hypothetical protein
MPRDYRTGFDESECFGPVRPDPTNDHPEQAIEWIQLGARLFAFVHGKLLSKSDRLHCKTVPRDQKCSQVRQHREQSRDHHSDASRFRMILKSLIPEAAGVLMTHNPAKYERCKFGRFPRRRDWTGDFSQVFRDDPG